MTDRLISADRFIRWLDVGHLCSPAELRFSELDVKGAIDDQPTADVPCLTCRHRCKDYKNYQPEQPKQEMNCHTCVQLCEGCEKGYCDSWEGESK